MARKALIAGTLKDLDDGRVAAAFDAELAAVMADLHDRPELQKAREVHLVFRLVPECEHGQCEYVKGDVQIYSRVPKRKTRVLDFATDVQGRLIFNDDSADNVDQNTMFPKDKEQPGDA